MPGSVRGVKWEDVNGNAQRDPDELGLPGVIIYADLNDNGLLDADESQAITTADIATTRFDEGGRYALDGLTAGHYLIREVVPDGFRQTFPLVDLPRPLPAEPSDNVAVDEFASVKPGRLDFQLVAGEAILTDVAITIHASIFVPIEIDVIARPNDGTVINLSGLQPNGGSGDTSVFEIMIISDGTDFDGELLFTDTSGGNAMASIPLTINVASSSDGAHHVTLGPGETLDGLDFGNQPVDRQPLPGDFNEDGSVNGADLDSWKEAYRRGDAPGAADAASSTDRMHGGSFLQWQRNFGRVSPLPATGVSSLVAASNSSVTGSGGAARAQSVPAELTRLPQPSSRGQFTPASRSQLDAVEAAFAESVQPRGRFAEHGPVAREPFDASTTAGPSREAVTRRADYDGFAAAVDAALGGEFAG